METSEGASPKMSSPLKLNSATQRLLASCESSPDAIGNFCSFACSQCGEEFRTLCMLRAHFKSTGHRKSSFDSLIKDAAKKIVAHRCKLCARYVMCEASKLYKHLTKAHGMSSIREYCRVTGVRYNPVTFHASSVWDYLKDSGPETTDVDNRCRFACRFCTKESNSWGALRGHLHQQHKGQKIEGREKYCLSDFLVSAVTHVCQLCQKKMACDVFLMRIHIRQRHKMTLREYVDKTGVKLIAFLKPETSREKGRKRAVGKEDRNKLRLPVWVDLASKAAEETTDVDNRCKFLCKFCPKESNSWGGLYNHLQKHHHDKKERGKTFCLASYLTTAVAHVCQLCQETILCDKIVIRMHVQRKHKMLLKDYVSDTGIKLVAQMLPQRSIKEPSKVTGKKVHSIKFHESSVWINMVHKVTETTDVDNRCQLKCRFCPKESNSWCALRGHLTVHHRGQNVEGKNRFYLADFLITAEAHICQVCKTKIVCDVFMIRLHVRQKHKMALKEYVATTGVNLTAPLRSEHLMLESSISNKDITIAQPGTVGNEQAKSATETSDVDNRCLFRCSFCPKESNTWCAMRGHLHGCHYDEKLKERKKFCCVDYLATTVTHVCQLCQKKILCDVFIIRNHAKTNHRMSLREYVSKTGTKLVARLRPERPSAGGRVPKQKVSSQAEMGEDFQNGLTNQQTGKMVFCDKTGIFKDITTDVRNSEASGVILPQDQQFTFAGNVDELRGFDSDYEIDMGDQLGLQDLPEKEISAKHTDTNISTQEQVSPQGDAPKLSHTASQMDTDSQRIRHEFAEDDVSAEEGNAEVLLDNVESLKEEEDEKCFQSTRALSKAPHVRLDSKEGNGKKVESTTVNISNEVVGNLCTFTCPVCGEEFKSVAAIRKHKAVTRHIETISHSKIVEDFGTKVIYHNCALCSKILLCETSVLSSHVKLAHHVANLEEYCRANKINLLKREMNNVVHKKPLIKKEIQLERTVRVERNADLQRQLEEGSLSENEVGNLCRFRCSQCQRVFNRVTALRTHFKIAHGGELNAKAIMANCSLQITSHKCLLCAKLLLCDTSYLQSHVRAKHGLFNLKDYCQRTGCKLKLRCKETSVRSIKEEDNQCIDVKEEEDVKIEEEEDDDVEVTSQIGDKCSFQCKHCQEKVFGSWSEMKDHCKSTHPEWFRRSRMDPSKWVVRKVFHRCQLCPERVLCDRLLIQQHLAKRHGFGSIRKYVEAVTLQVTVTEMDAAGEHDAMAVDYQMEVAAKDKDDSY